MDSSGFGDSLSASLHKDMIGHGIYTVACRRQFERCKRRSQRAIYLIVMTSIVLAQRVLRGDAEHSSIPPLFTPGVSRGFFWKPGTTR